MRLSTFLIGKNQTKLVRALSMAILCAAVLTVSGGSVLYAAKDEWKPYPILESCSIVDEEYEDLFYNRLLFDEWADEYHFRVNEVVDEFMNPLRIDIPECTEDNLFPLIVNGSFLGFMAKELPPWQDPDDFAKLDRNDIGIVLLEFLRVYECALKNATFDIGDTLQTDLVKRQERATDAGEEDVLTLGDLVLIIGLDDYSQLSKEIDRMLTILAEELSTARPAMERTLAIVSSIVRLEPLSAELECLQRATLDLRNGLALSADASVCLPKAWDVKDPLRDLQAPAQGAPNDS